MLSSLSVPVRQPAAVLYAARRADATTTGSSKGGSLTLYGATGAGPISGPAAASAPVSLNAGLPPLAVATAIAASDQDSIERRRLRVARRLALWRGS
jgi:hypothetical protein